MPSESQLNNTKPNVVASILVSFIFLFIFLFSFQYNSAANAEISIKNPNLKAELVVSGLKSPTSMSFLDEDDLLVLEKDGVVQRIVGSTIFEDPVLNITSIVNNTRERGLLGIAISDEFSKAGNRSQTPRSGVYLYFTEKIPNHIHKPCNDVSCMEGRVVNSLYVYEMNKDHLVNPKLIFSIPSGNADIGLEHLGGKIVAGPDDRIYISGGDGYPCRDFEDCKISINEGHLNSKTANLENGNNVTGLGGILATSKDGKNHVSDSILGDDFPLDLYYAYGVRNSFGLDFDPLTGNLWDTENGPYFGDEINLVEPGFNSGWARVQGNWPITDYNMLVKDRPPGYHFPIDVTVNLDRLHSFDGKGEYSSPEFIWNKSTGPTALKFFDSDKLGKEHKQDMFVGSYSKGRIYHFDLNQNRNSIVTDSQLRDNVAYNDTELAHFIFAEGFAPITDLQVSPDGFLYILTFDGSIWKIIRSDTKS